MPQHHSSKPELEIPGPFTLGTAQLGMPYGLGAASGGLEGSVVGDILTTASNCRIRWLDTAHAYGSAEARIGQWLAASSYTFKIATKLPSLTRVRDDQIAEVIDDALSQSLARLGTRQIDICLTHGAADFMRPGVIDALRLAQERGSIGRFGASAYTVKEITEVLLVRDVGVLQLPLNVASCEIFEAGILEEAADRGITVFARSIFLQGALLLPPGSMPPHIAPLGKVVVELAGLAHTAGLPLPAFLMGAVARLKGVSSLVIGVDSVDQLAELADFTRLPLPDAGLCEAAFKLARSLPPSVIDPRTWPVHADHRR